MGRVIQEGKGQETDEKNGQDHLGAASQKNGPFQRDETRCGKFQAYDKEQKNDSDLGQHLNGMGISDEMKTGGTDEDSGQKKSYQGRNAKPVQGKHHQRGSPEDNYKGFQKVFNHMSLTELLPGRLNCCSFLL
jgi:hypothetical protein